MLIVHGRLSSINVQKVMFAVEELGLAYERHDAGGAFGRVDTPEYRAMNPNGKVPVVEDDGFVLWESNAIVRYLAAAHGAGGLWPDNRHLRADADRWMDWQATEATPAMRDVFWQLIRTKPAERNQAAIEASVRQSERMMAILDARLTGRLFVVGDCVTVADIALGPVAHRWLNLPLGEAGFSRTPRPQVERWYERLRSRPAAQKSMPLPVT